MRLTASRRELYSRCQYFALPDVPWDDNSSAASDAGSEAHEGFEALHNGDEATLGESARRKVEALRPSLNAIQSTGTKSSAEVSFAWDPKTDEARIVGVGLSRAERDAKADPSHMTGTADLVVIQPRAAIAVWDYKHDSGKGVDARAQLRTLALFAARAFGASTVETGVVLYGENDSRIVPGETLTALDLDMEADVLRDALNQLVLLPPPEPQPGPWCKRCPAAAQCPATVDALAQAVPTTSLVRQHRLSTIIASQEHAAWTLSAIDQVEAALKVIKGQLRAYADQHGGIPLPDGTEWSGQESKQERPLLDVPGALALVQASGADAAVEYSTTWAALERALGKADAKILRAKLAKMGATKTTKFPKYEARKPRKGRAA